MLSELPTSSLRCLIANYTHPPLKLYVAATSLKAKATAASHLLQDRCFESAAVVLVWLGHEPSHRADTTRHKATISRLSGRNLVWSAHASHLADEMVD
jgi:hypothetical protein